MKYDVVINFIYELINNGVKIWAQNENIKLSILETYSLHDTQKDFIKENKNEILEYLKLNNISTSDSSILILHTNLNKVVLSFAQERLWFIEKYEQGTNAYIIPTLLEISPKVNLNILQQSIKEIFSRHEILRTLIKEDEDGSFYQVVLDDKEHPLVIKDIEVRDKKELDQELKEEVNRIFNLSEEYPIRVCVYRLNNETLKTPEYYLSIVTHHIAFDGWSADVLLKELEQLYEYYSEKAQGKNPQLKVPTLNIQYRDFALWQRNYLVGDKLKDLLAYWKGKLLNYEELSLLPDKRRPKQVDYKGEDIYFEISEDVSKKLRELAKELKVSLYSLLLSGYYLMLRAYSNQNDIIIGTPIANRHYDQVENLIGFFVNALPIRMQIEGQELIKEFIQKTGNEVIEAQLYQDLPFEKLVKELNIPKDTSKHPIFQVMFGVQSFGDQLFYQSKGIEESNLRNLVEIYKSNYNLHNIARYDITTFIDDSQDKLKGSFNYGIEIFNESTIKGFIETYLEILKQFANLAENNTKQESTRIADIEYLSEEQYLKTIYEWNKTTQEYDKDKTIHQLFEEQVERTPENIAVIYEDVELTYKELNNRANNLAYYLKTNFNTQPDTLVALCLDRSEHMLISILAVLKAGGAYVPIDSSYPDERISYILKDTATTVVLTNEIYKQRLENIINTSEEVREGSIPFANQPGVIAVDSDLLQAQLAELPKGNISTETKSNNLAYVIYTSGTTGNPKGAMIEQGSYIATIDCIKKLYFNNIKLIQTYSITNYVFDIFGLEYGLTLLNGGSITLANTAFSVLDCSNYNFIQLTPSVCNLKLNDFINMSHLKLLLGGENLTTEVLNSALNKTAEVINVYGPTETTIWSASKLYKDGKKIDNVSLGTALFNETLYVLDEGLKPLPIGAIGELYIGGVGLARGYLNKPDLTTERFIPNPFQTEEEKLDIEHYGPNGRNARIYKTGDLVRWLPDGNLEYINRNDFQVKIRGHRIELGEIETALTTYNNIKQSIVLAKDHLDDNNNSTGNKYLVGYYVSDTGNKLDEEAILQYLYTKLPEYMVPSILVHLEKLPLTINGKLDRKALPDPEFTSTSTYIAPRNELEQKVANTWAEVLGLSYDKVGIHDDFFRLGGDSILVMKLIAKIKHEFKINISVKQVFNTSNLLDLAKILTKE